MAETQQGSASQAQEIPDYGETLASWEFYEHESYERGRWWYISAATVVIILLGFAYFDSNYLLAVIVALTIIIYVISEWRGPAYHTFAITEDGLLAGPQFFPYTELKNFFVIYQPPRVKMLYFDPKSIFKPHIGVPLGDMDPNAIRDILANYLEEDLDHIEEPTSDYFGRLFKL